MKTTIVTLAYNHERFIREALSSACDQSRPADEIIVIDDASPDGTAAIIEQFIAEHAGYAIRFFRNERNLGVSASFAKAVSLASGDILVMMAGDDVSAPSRVERSARYFSERPSAMALITNAEIIDEESRSTGVLDNCAGHSTPVALGLEDLLPNIYFLRGRSSCGAASAYRAEIFRSFSPFRPGLYAEDDPAAFRAMLLGTCDFLPEPLVRWRRHEHNLSHGTGARRGPEMATHFKKCEAMVDQMIADAREFLKLSATESAAGVDRALANLHYQKAKWALWAIAHENGAGICRFAASVRELFRCGAGPIRVAAEAWRPLLKMLTPYRIQQGIVNARRAK